MFPCTANPTRQDYMNEMEYLLGIWKDIIIKYSNNRYSDLRPHLKDAIDKVVSNYDIKFIRTQSLASQLDKPVVWNIIKLAVKTNCDDVIDMIYKRTRASMFRYFYHDKLIRAYLALNQMEKAVSVFNYMLGKEHCAYWYAIYNYSTVVYEDYPQFQKIIKDVKNIAIRKLLTAGEKVELGEMNLTELQSLLSDVERYKENDNKVVYTFDAKES